MAENTIKINELATANISLSDFFVKCDASGIATKNTIQGLANLLTVAGDVPFKGKLLIADTPVAGWYFAGESGTYTNAGGLVVSVSSNIVIIIAQGDPLAFSKIDIPVSLTIDATVIDGSNNAVSGNAVFDAIATETQNRELSEFQRNFFPFNNVGLVDSAVKKETTRAIKEAYITDYDSNFDYLFQSLRRNQLVSGTYYTGITINKVNKGTTTVVKTYSYLVSSPTPITSVNESGYQLITLTNSEGYVIVNWKELTDGTGYGSTSLSNLANENLGNLNYNKRIANFLNNYTKTQADAKFATIANTYTKTENDNKYATITNLALKADKTEVQYYVNPKNPSTNVSSYVQNGAINVSGVFEANPNNRVIIDYPILEGKKFTVTGLGTGNKYLIFKDASNVNIGTTQFVVNGTIYTAPVNSAKVSVTLVGSGDPAGDVNYRFYLGDTDNDLRVNTINGLKIVAEKVANESSFLTKPIFPYLSSSQITTTLMQQVQDGVFEIYIPDFSTDFDYLLSVFRKQQDLSGVITIDIRVAQVVKNTTTLIKYYQFQKTGTEAINYDFGTTKQLITLTNGGYLLVDWSLITSGTGYGELNRNYLLSNEIGNLDFNQEIKLKKYFYDAVQSDARFALKTEVAGSDISYTKAQSDANFAAKSTTETQLTNHETRITDNETDISTIQSDYSVINSKLDTLVATPPTGGAVTGNNTWTGQNGFTQPVEGVAATADTHFIRQGEYKQTLNRFVDAADFGFLPTASATANVTALNNALNGGNKTVIISKAGIYEMNNVAYIDDNTEIIFGKGVTLKKAGWFSFLLLNRGALTHSYNSNIKITGLAIDANQFDVIPPIESPLYGLRGHISFLCVNNLTILDFKCFNYNTPQWALHVCSFNNFILDRFICIGNKDGVHLGRGDGFVIKNGYCETYDDAIALNGHDYPNCNPEVGDIKNGLIENVVDAYKATTTGYFSRLLIGAWVDWYLGIEIQNGDTVVNNGRTYRAVGGAGTFLSETEPTLTTFDATQADTSGFTWKLYQNDATYSANIYNIEYKNIRCYDARIFLNVELDTGGTIFNRSLHPDVLPQDYPTVEKLTVRDCDLQASTDVIRTASLYDITFDNVFNCTKRILLNPVNALTGIGKVLIKNCDFTKVTVGNAIEGANGYVKIRDCNYNSSIPISLSGRVDSNENLSSFSSIAPQKGDMVKVANVVYVRGDSSWIALN